MSGGCLQLVSLQTPVRLAETIVLEAGTCAAFSGASGSGKSRFFRALADLDPNDGEVLLNNVTRSHMTAPQWRAAVTYVAAESGWWAEKVVNHFQADDLDAAIHLAEELDLPAAALEWHVARLSSGERQRLALVRALVQEPDVLLLDEPTAPLDVSATAKVEALLTKQLARGAIILLITHDPQQAERLASQNFEIVELEVREARP